MRRTIVIVLSVLAVTLAFSWVMTRRLISTWHPEGAPSAPATRPIPDRPPR